MDPVVALMLTLVATVELLVIVHLAATVRELVESRRQVLTVPALRLYRRDVLRSPVEEWDAEHAPAYDAGFAVEDTNAARPDRKDEFE